MANKPAEGLGTIVLATDFSDNAGIARDRAVELALHHGARILLTHVVVPEIPPVGGPELMVMPADIETKLREAAEAGVAKWAEEIRARGVEVETAIERGFPAERIVAAARDHGADLIVVGTRGNTGFKHLLLGSVAEEIVRTANCAVLTVHPGDTRSLEPIRSLLLPTDFSEGSAHVIEDVVSLFHGVANGRILMVHAYQIPVMLSPLWGFSTEQPTLLADARKLALEAIEPAAQTLRDQGFDVETVVAEGDAATIITDLAEERAVDVIGIGTRGLSKFKQVLLGSTAERVVEHAKCPVFSVHRIDV